MKSTESSPSLHNLKSQPEEYDLVILGGGTGGATLAATIAGEGKHVAIIGRKYIGGSCPNIACLPSKNIIHNARVASYVRHSDELGIARDGFKGRSLRYCERGLPALPRGNGLQLANHPEQPPSRDIAVLATVAQVRDPGFRD